MEGDEEQVRMGGRQKNLSRFAQNLAVWVCLDRRIHAKRGGQGELESKLAKPVGHIHTVTWSEDNIIIKNKSDLNYELVNVE